VRSVFRGLSVGFFLLSLTLAICACGGSSSGNSKSSASPTPTATPTPTSALGEKITALVNSQILSKSSPKAHVGVAVVVVEPASNPAGYETEQFYFGDLRATNGRPMTLDANTEFYIGSVSKTFTANLLAQQTYNNQSILDQPLNHYLPDAPTFNGAQIHIRDLADYTSGLPDDPFIPFSSTPCLNGAFGPPCWPAQEMIGELARPSVSLAFAPGTQYLYSNWAVDVLAVVEAMIGGSPGKDYDELLQDWETMLNEQVIAPIGLAHTHLYRPSQDDPLLPLAYTDPTKAEVITNHVSQFPGAWGDTGIVLTPGDFLIYLQYMMGLIQTSTSYVLPFMLQPLTPVIGVGSNLDFIWFQFTLTDNGPPCFNKSGQVGGFTSYIEFLPATRTGVAVVTNEADLLPDSIGYRAMLYLNGLSDGNKPGPFDPGH